MSVFAFGLIKYDIVIVRIAIYNSVFLLYAHIRNLHTLLVSSFIKFNYEVAWINIFPD